ncbi:hypothetical protein Tco_1558118 [Tanacetum coccineum]
MPLKRTTTTTTAPMTNAAIKQLIAQGVANALAELEANRTSRNGDDSHNSRTSSKRIERAARGTVSHEVAYGMTWKELKKMMTDKYCPRGEIKKPEIKLWNLKVKVEKYVGGLPDMIQGSVMASKPKTLQDAIEAYSAGFSEKKEYVGTLPLCNKFKFHHNGPCTRTLTCYECGNQGYCRSDYPELKNQNHGNQAKVKEAHGMVYALGGGETDQDLDDMEDDINA